MRLNNKVAIITGAASGMGEAMAYSFAKEKELIVICGTFFIMSEAKNALGIICEEDYIDLNERFTPSN